MKLHVMYGLINTAFWLFGVTWGFKTGIQERQMVLTNTTMKFTYKKA
jgi:hypothetical protein